MEQNKKTSPQDHLIVSLDYNNIDDVKTLVEQLGKQVSIYKVGLELYLNTKGEVLEYLNKKNKKVFLDLKFHDIPNTTAMSCDFATRTNVFMFNIHVSGGSKMIQECVNTVTKTNKNPLLIGVTALTSLNDLDIKELFDSNLTASDLAKRLAKVAKANGLNGVVCSANEAKEIKNTCGSNFITVCPGIRPEWSQTNDQQRIMTPKEAILNKADFLVIGRPILKSDNKLEAVNKILDEIKQGMDLLKC